MKKIKDYDKTCARNRWMRLSLFRRRFPKLPLCSNQGSVMALIAHGDDLEQLDDGNDDERRGVVGNLIGDIV